MGKKIRKSNELKSIAALSFVICITVPEFQKAPGQEIPEIYHEIAEN